MTYMVMETHLSYSVVLDEAGRFLKVANMNHEVGQTLDRVVPVDLPGKKVIPFKLFTAIGALAACLVLIFSVYWSSYMSPFASIYLTINPEVRMEISKKDTVVGLKGVNGDGASLITGYDFRGKSFNQVTDDLLERAIKMGFLSDGGMVTVNIDSPDEAWFTNTGIALRQNLNDYLSERMTVTIEVKQYSPPADPTFNSGESRDLSSKPTLSETPSTPDGDSDYGDSDYGGQTTSPSASSALPSHPAASNDSGYGDSSYSAPVSSEDDGGSDPDDPGDSNYDESDPDDDTDDDD